MAAQIVFEGASEWEQNLFDAARNLNSDALCRLLRGHAEAESATAALVLVSRTIATRLRRGSAVRTDTQVQRDVDVSAAIECVRALVELGGADVNFPDQHKHTILHAAADIGCVALVRLALRFGADANAQTFLGETALHLAVGAESEECVRVLMLEGRVDCTKRTVAGRLALDYLDGIANQSSAHNAIRASLTQGMNFAASLSSASGTAPGSRGRPAAASAAADQTGLVESAAMPSLEGLSPSLHGILAPNARLSQSDGYFDAAFGVHSAAAAGLASDAHAHAQAHVQEQGQGLAPVPPLQTSAHQTIEHVQQSPAARTNGTIDFALLACRFGAHALIHMPFSMHVAYEAGVMSGAHAVHGSALACMLGVPAWRQACMHYAAGVAGAAAVGRSFALSVMHVGFAGFASKYWSRWLTEFFYPTCQIFVPTWQCVSANASLSLATKASNSFFAPCVTSLTPAAASFGQALVGLGRLVRSFAWIQAVAVQASCVLAYTWLPLPDVFPGHDIVREAIMYPVYLSTTIACVLIASGTPLTPLSVASGLVSRRGMLGLYSGLVPLLAETALVVRLWHTDEL